MASVKAVWEDGVFKPTEPVHLLEKTVVQVVIPADAEDDDPTGWKTADELIGCITDGPEGESIGEEHDRYLYGDRRRQ